MSRPDLTDIKRVAFVVHHERTDAPALLREVTAWLTARKIEGWLTPADAEAIDAVDLGAPTSLERADLVITLGGDGTVLRAIGLLDGAPVPVLGINMGRLGYLTEIEPPQAQSALARILDPEAADQWWLDERMMLDVRQRGTDRRWRVLNEVVVEKYESGHTIRLLVRLDDEPFTSYAADGLIVATPTGSTAYSLSARGPVVSPRHRALLLTPVSPHMLFDRSLVLDPSEVVEIELISPNEAEVVIDGRIVARLGLGDVVTCTPSAATARFVRFREYRYHQILKAKFGLTDR